MLTILSATEVSAIADFVKSITDQLGAIQGVLDASQTVAFETPTATVAAPPAPKPPRKYQSQGGTRKTRRKQREALNTVQVIQIKKRLAGGEGGDCHQPGLQCAFDHDQCDQVRQDVEARHAPATGKLRCCVV